MYVGDIYAANRALGRPTISFEFFPPKTAEGEETLFAQVLPALRALAPDFISVTYGAGGSTRDGTLRIVARARRDLGLEAMAHLTCVGASRAELREVLAAARAVGIENILALRGDRPAGESAWRPAAGGLTNAHELVRLVRAEVASVWAWPAFRRATRIPTATATATGASWRTKSPPAPSSSSPSSSTTTATISR